MVKPFLYGIAMEQLGEEAVLERIGVEPTGDAFNTIKLQPKTHRPYNPMVNAGAPDIKISKGDGWCVRTKDGSDSAQCEVQLVVTEDGYELLSW